MPLQLPGMSPLLTVLVVATAAMFAVMLAFLAAAARLRRANTRKAERWSKLEHDWGVTIDCIARGQVRPEELHSRIEPAERIVFLDYLYKSIVREDRPVRRELYRSLGVPYRRVLEERAHSGDVWQRARALRTMAEVAGADAAGLAMQMLDDPAPHVAMTAARVYAQIDAGSIHPLLDRIERYRTWDRRLLRSILASFGTDAVPALDARLADTGVPAYVRAVCAEALGAIGHDVDSDTAIAILSNETDIDLVAATLRLLRLPVSSAERDAVRALCTSGDPVVRGQAVACLARIGDSADLGVVEQALADPSPWVTLSATRGLVARRGAVEARPRPAVDHAADAHAAPDPMLEA